MASARSHTYRLRSAVVSRVGRLMFSPNGVSIVSRPASSAARTSGRRRVGLERAGTHTSRPGPRNRMVNASCSTGEWKPLMMTTSLWRQAWARSWTASRMPAGARTEQSRASADNVNREQPPRTPPPPACCAPPPTCRATYPRGQARLDCLPARLLPLAQRRVGPRI